MKGVAYILASFFFIAVYVLSDIYLSDKYGGGVATLFGLGALVVLACLRPFLKTLIDAQDQSVDKLDSTAKLVRLAPFPIALIGFVALMYYAMHWAPAKPPAMFNILSNIAASNGPKIVIVNQAEMTWQE